MEILLNLPLTMVTPQLRRLPRTRCSRAAPFVFKKLASRAIVTGPTSLLPIIVYIVPITVVAVCASVPVEEPPTVYAWSAGTAGSYTSDAAAAARNVN